MEDRGLTLKGEITMMKAIKNFMDKPITYGGYAKMWFGKEKVEQEEYEI